MSYLWSYVFFQKKCDRHIEAVHGGKKPFKCQICDQCFPQSNGLSSHVKRVHEEKKIECGICGAMISKVYFKVHTAYVLHSRR